MVHEGLRGRVALVTGANSGIGAAIARALAAQGARVAVHYLGNAPPPEPGYKDWANYAGEPGAREILRQIAEAGTNGIAVEADLADPSAAARIFDHTEQALGAVEILVNNAAHCEIPDTILATSAGLIDRTFAVNVRAPLLLISEFVHRHQARSASWGRMVNISTDAAQCFPTEITYGASKAALEASTRAVACEVGHLGITVNAIACGPVQSGYITAEIEARVLPEIPLGRIGQPEDIAGVVVFLCSEQARWITGQVIKVSGGHEI